MSGRYAIYYTPPPGEPLAEFGARWLGWDCAAGTPRQQPAVPGLDIGRITDRPRKYGFHATLKPPFHLADGTREDALIEAVAEFCSRTAAVSVEELKLARIGSFLALVPAEGEDRIGALARQVVLQFDPFRGVPSPEDATRRQNKRLTARQKENLMRWGYPYVMEDFRFHMTLTGPLSEVERAGAEAALHAELAAVSLAPMRIDALTVLKSDATDRFVSRVRIPLRDRP